MKSQQPPRQLWVAALNKALKFFWIINYCQTTVALAWIILAEWHILRIFLYRITKKFPFSSWRRQQELLYLQALTHRLSAAGSGARGKEKVTLESEAEFEMLGSIPHLRASSTKREVQTTSGCSSGTPRAELGEQVLVSSGWTVSKTLGLWKVGRKDTREVFRGSRSPRGENKTHT